MGMGKYQWYIWGLCGFGHTVDLLWAQAFGLVLDPLQQESGFDDGWTGNLSPPFSSGLTAGAFAWGVLVDIVGRKWAFNMTVLISSVFGLCLGVSNSYTTLLALAAFVGFSMGGNIPIDTTIALEFTPRRRVTVLQRCALRPCCHKSDNMRWRCLLYSLGAITLLVFLLRFVAFRFQESPSS